MAETKARAGPPGFGGWRIARIHGVDVKIHFSLLFILLYAAFVSAAQFPAVVSRSGVPPGAIGGSPLLWGLILAVGLFLSVLIHEFAHVLVAQGMGVRVRGITLMMLGGVSEMERIPEKPYAEFKVSVVGPLTSLAIGGGLLIIRGLTRWGDLALFCYWLARINLVLGVFNLLPAFPLDGGRVFRSLLAARMGTTRATATSVRVAEGFAWLMGLYGFVSFNFLLMLIALFVYSAARGEWAMTVSRGMLEGSTVRDAWTEAEPLPESALLRSALEAMLRTRLRVLPVATADGEPALVSSEGMKRIPRELWDVRRVRDAMVGVGRFARLDDRLDELLPELNAIGAMPVLDEGRVRGVVTSRDVGEILEFKGLVQSQPRAGRRSA